MKIAIIDADLIYRKKHRFPNLACMKISAYYKELNNKVELKLDYNNLEQYDKVFISKVFTDTYIDKTILSLDNVEYGGTGFCYDKAKPLKYEIEHHIPDYNLYNDWINKQLKNGVKSKELKYYTDYSIGFLTRGCFRQCEFCVNKNYRQAVKHSSVYEFMDKTRPKLCFLDDNFLACKDWKNIIKEVKETGKSFEFKQGLDERLLTDETIKEVFSWKYGKDYIFAFDNIADRELIESKLKRIFEIYPNFKKNLKFYVLCGFDRNNKYDENFWKQDIIDTFERIFILAKYSAVPYIMRFERCYTSKWRGIYINFSSWCNQPNFFKKLSFATFSKIRGMSNENYKKYKDNFNLYLNEVGNKGAAWQYYEELINTYPEMNKYTNIIPDSVLEYGNGVKMN